MSGKALDQLALKVLGDDFHNTVSIRRKTCWGCRGVLLNSSPEVCPKCSASNDSSGNRAGIDRSGSVFYACKGFRSGELMHRYKDAHASPSDLILVKALTRIALAHSECVGKLAEMPSQYWASVPSLRKRSAEHPFHRLVAEIQNLGAEIVVGAANRADSASDAQRREVNPDFFTVLTPIPKGSHITVVDDTWVSGGHARSVAQALKRAGAKQVSVLALARWLDPTKPYPRWVYENVIRPQRFDPDICPWTGGACPSTARTGVGQGDGVIISPRAARRRSGLCRKCCVELPATGKCDYCE